MSDLERIAVIRRTVEDCIKYSRTACTWGHEADIKFLLEKYDALEARCAALLADVNQDEGYERLKAALQSIASNTCCDKCQEAALVARRALGLTLETDVDPTPEHLLKQGYRSGKATDPETAVNDLQGQDQWTTESSAKAAAAAYQAKIKGDDHG